VLPLTAFTLNVTSIVYKTQFDICLVAITDALMFSVMIVAGKTFNCTGAATIRYPLEALLMSKHRSK
jgi:hypothetical protein